MTIADDPRVTAPAARKSVNHDPDLRKGHDLAQLLQCSRATIRTRGREVKVERRNGSSTREVVDGAAEVTKRHDT